MQKQEQVSHLLANRFVTVTEASKFLALSRAKVYHLMNSGDIKYAKFGVSRRIPMEILIKYAESCMVK